MLILASVNDRINLITSAAVAVDVHVSYVDVETATKAVTPDRKNSAVSTATTTDISGNPATGKVRNVETIHARNKGAADCILTVVHTDGAIAAQLHQVTLSPGEALQYTEKLGFHKLTAAEVILAPTVADQVIGASTTAYVTGSAIKLNKLGRPLAAGCVVRWEVTLSKSGAGTAAMTWDVRFGLLGTTADTSRASLSTGAQTAVVDVGQLDVSTLLRIVGAAGVAHTGMKMAHGLNATGLGLNAVPSSQVTSAAFDMTGAELTAGLSLTTGASHSITIHQVIPQVRWPE